MQCYSHQLTADSGPVRGHSSTPATRHQWQGHGLLDNTLKQPTEISRRIWCFLSNCGSFPQLHALQRLQLNIFTIHAVTQGSRRRSCGHGTVVGVYQCILGPQQSLFLR